MEFSNLKNFHLVYCGRELTQNHFYGYLKFKILIDIVFDRLHQYSEAVASSL